MTEIPIVVSVETAKAKQGSDEAVRSLDKIRAAAKNTGDSTKQMGSVFSQAFNTAKSSINGAKQAMDSFSLRMQSLHRTVFSLKGALIGLGMGALIKSFLDASNVTEQYRVRLEVLLGSIRKGNDLFAKLIKLAAVIPQTYEETINASVKLSTALGTNVNEIVKWTEITADLASAFGLTMDEASGQMARSLSAGIAAADLFRDRGVSAFLGFTAGVQYSAEETKKRILAAWEDTNSRFKGITARLAETWAGVISMIQDRWFFFRNALMDGAPFEYLKAGFQLINEYFGINADNMDQKAKELGVTFVNVFKKIIMGGAAVADTMAPVFRVLSVGIKSFAEFWNKLPPWMQEIGVVAGLLFGVKGAALVLGGTAAVDAIINKVRDLGDYAAGRGILELDGDKLEDYLKRQKEGRKGVVDSVFRDNKDYDAGKVRNTLNTGSLFGGDLKETESYSKKAEELLKSMDDRVVDNRIKAKKRLEREGAELPGGVTLPKPPSPANNNSRSNNRTIGTPANDWVNPDIIIGPVKQANEEMREIWTDTANHAESSMKSAISNFIKTGKFDMMSFSDSIKDMWVDTLADMAAKAAKEAIFGSVGGSQGGGNLFSGGASSGGGGLGSMFSSMFGGGGQSSGGSAAPWINPDTGSAMPWVNPDTGYAFANGGVVDNATGFNFGGGKKGVAGEAGPEGILPLKRGRDGKLGVDGGEAGGTSVVINMTVNTPNAQTFLSNKGEIAAQTATSLQRAMRSNG